MRKALTIAALAAVLVVAASAFAATRTYKGQIKGDPPSTVALRVKQSDGERRVKEFVAKSVLISCRTGEARLKSATITGLVPVDDNGEFKVTGSNEGQKLKVTGKLTGKRSAKGAVHYSGPTIVDDEEQDCDSGRLEWRATR